MRFWKKKEAEKQPEVTLRLAYKFEVVLLTKEVRIRKRDISVFIRGEEEPRKFTVDGKVSKFHELYRRCVSLCTGECFKSEDRERLDREGHFEGCINEEPYCNDPYVPEIKNGAQWFSYMDRFGETHSIPTCDIKEIVVGEVWADENETISVEYKALKEL